MSASGPSGPLVLFTVIYISFHLLSFLAEVYWSFHVLRLRELIDFCLFDLILYVPVDNSSVMSGQVFLG